MKKLVMTAAVLACAATVASAATVTSANIVGYSKKAFAAGDFKIVAPQFLASDTDGIAVGDAFSGASDYSTLFVWNSGYVSYTYFGGDWYDGGYSIVNDTLKIGQGDAVWLNGAEASDVIMSGEVPTADSVTNSVVAGFNLVANPYPVALKLGAIPTTTLSDFDLLFVWDSGYVSYTYYAGDWYDGGYSIVNDTVSVPVGDGFWLSCAAGGDLIFNKAY
jgi:hypothetical protein